MCFQTTVLIRFLALENTFVTIDNTVLTSCHYSMSYSCTHASAHTSRQRTHITLYDRTLHSVPSHLSRPISSDPILFHPIQIIASYFIRSNPISSDPIQSVFIPWPALAQVERLRAEAAAAARKAHVSQPIHALHHITAQFPKSLALYLAVLQSAALSHSPSPYQH